jgi:hypothetical protein
LFIALGDSQDHHRKGPQNVVKTSGRISERETLNQAPLSPDQLEEIMPKSPAIGKLGILAVALLVLAAGHANARGGARAPTKDSGASQLAAQQTNHKTAKNDFGITEYSSSSARRH